MEEEFPAEKCEYSVIYANGHEQQRATAPL